MFDRAQIEGSLLAEAAGDAAGSQTGAPGAPTKLTLQAGRVIAETRSKKRLLDLQALCEAYSDLLAEIEGPDESTRAALSRAQTVGAARSAALEYHQRVGDSHTNGTVIRCAPLALASPSAERADEIARREASLTHHDLAAAWASAAVCAAIWASEDALSAAAYVVEGDQRFNPAIRAAEGSESELRELVRGEEPRACWVPLGCALWASERGLGVGEAVERVAALGGEASANASVVGAVLGARQSAQARELAKKRLGKDWQTQISAVSAALSSSGRR